MRVLYVNHTSRVSGGEISLLNLLEALPPDCVPLVACPPGTLAERVQQLEIDVRPIEGTDGSLRLHPLRTPLALAQIGRAALQVRRLVAASAAELVHANSIRAGLIVAGAPGSPAANVVHVRDCLPPGRASALALRAIGTADALIANSAYTRSTLGALSERAHVIHNAVDLARFDRAGLDRDEGRARLGLGAGPVLAVVAQITPWKGQDDAIRIAGRLRRSHPDLQLLLVGSAKFDSNSTRYDNAAYLDSLRALAAQEGNGTVVMLGEREDIPQLLRAVDLLLAPSWEEPFGRTIVEAMAAGVPVAATEVGGPPEILAEGGGLLLPPRQPRLWAEAIGPLLAQPQRLEAIGKRGRVVAHERFAAGRHASEVLAVYESVLGARAST
jgi:glycosyltransferase involved in cell wall biosynthesis